MYLIPDSVLETMTCYNCHKFLSVGPVIVYPNRNVKCGRCFQLGYDSGVFSQYGLIAKHGMFKCINRFDGCRQLLLFSGATKHESQCKSKIIICPVCPESTEVPTFLLIKHFKENHSDCFLATPSFKIDVSAPCIQKYLYRVKDNLFLIECQVTFEDMISFNTFFLGEPEKAEKIKQKFSIYHKDLSENIVTLTKTCLPFGCEDSGAFLPMKREVQFIFVVFELLHDLDEFFIFPGSISKTKRSPLPIPLKMKLVSSTPMVHFSECGFDSGINISCEMKDKSKISQPFLFGKERVPANMENEKFGAPKISNAKFGAPKISNAMKDQIKIGPPSIFGEGSIFGKERVPANIENEEKFGGPEISNAMKDQITTGPPSIFGGGSIFGKERVPANMENEKKFGAPKISNVMKDQITTGPPSIFDGGSIFGKERVPANIENEEKFGGPEISNAMKDQIMTGPPSIFGGGSIFGKERVLTNLENEENKFGAKSYNMMKDQLNRLFGEGSEFGNMKNEDKV